MQLSEQQIKDILAKGLELNGIVQQSTESWKDAKQALTEARQEMNARRAELAEHLKQLTVNAPYQKDQKVWVVRKPVGGLHNPYQHLETWSLPKEAAFIDEVDVRVNLETGHFWYWFALVRVKKDGKPSKVKYASGAKFPPEQLQLFTEEKQPA